MNFIQTRRLTKRYGSFVAVNELDMRVAAGDIYGFVGKNGAGKSTTMKMIAGLVAPTSGELSLFSQCPYARTENASASRAASFSTSFSRIGALIEEPGIIPTLSAEENMMAKALAVGVARPRACVRELIEVVGLQHTGARKVKKFSQGMKQRLGLALALIGSPDLLLLDEPFNGMDPETTRDLRQMLVALNRERNVTIVISSHVLDQLMRVANRFGVIAQGSMVKEFTDEELHAACGSTIRVKTAQPSLTLALLEERLPQARFRAEPDGAILVAGGTSMPSVEEVSAILHDTDQAIRELSVIERDIEDYFVELMGDGNTDQPRGEEA